MGTPDFAVESLRALVEGGYNVVATVTMPDKPAGRGHHLLTSPVKDYALSQGIPVLQPEKLKAPEFLSQLSSFDAQLFIVVAFRMLPEVVWSMPSLGTFNLHGSLLPKYRGAAPINWAVINGEKETGVTTFFLKHEIDTGDLILQERIPIGEDENVGSVHDRLMTLGAGLVTRTVDLIIDSVNTGKPVPTTPQEKILNSSPETQRTLPLRQGEYPKGEGVDKPVGRRSGFPSRGVDCSQAPKIFKETCEIDLTKTALEVKNFVRGLSPYPAAWTNLRVGDRVFENTKIFEVRLLDSSPKIGEVAALPTEEDEAAPNLLLADATKRIVLRASDGDLEVLSLQVPGKKRLSAKDFLNGLR